MSKGFRLGVVLLVSLAATACPELSGPRMPAPHRDAKIHPIPEAVPTSAVSLNPLVKVSNGSSHQHRRIQEAVVRFTELGLLLPDLEVHFARDTESCQGHLGLFQPQRTPWRITICHDAGFVYDHELAHAWELANLEDRMRVEFMELREYPAWSGHDVPWSQRGVEGVAFVIQQGISGLPLPPVLGAEVRSRLEAFELLTGQPAPRLVEWIKSREVACSHRPTALSRSLADAAGNDCSRAPPIDSIIR
jgi:hypothetical protein